MFRHEKNPNIDFKIMNSDRGSSRTPVTLIKTQIGVFGWGLGAESWWGVDSEGGYIFSLAQVVSLGCVHSPERV